MVDPDAKNSNRCRPCRGDWQTT